MSPQHNTLSLQGRTLSLQPKVMAVLCYLARHRDRVVSNDELLDQVWQGRVVTHASVQKSMNTLRNALAELAGAREFVAHFSKRGYQLVVPVDFAPVEIKPEETVPPPPAKPVARRGRAAALIGLPLLLGLFGVLIWFAGEQGGVEKPTFAQVTQTAYAAAQPLAIDGKRDRHAEPHPDGRRIAFLRDSVTEGGSQSQILIREAGGADWVLAGVDGFWVDLAWSPSGRNLVATEIRRAEGLPSSPDYFEKPNYLYTFHIFTLDFRGERLLEKNLLSQWQGAVESVTWWDDNTLEFVASLGPGSTNERYRYLIAEQALSVVNPLESGFVPLQSTVHDKLAAVVSRQRSQVQIEILNARQQRLTVASVPTAALDISWVPDGSGILLWEKDSKKLSRLDLSGELTPLQYSVAPGFALDRPRYSRDGKSILLTASLVKSDFQQLDFSGQINPIAAQSPIIGQPALAPEGDAIVFVAGHNDQYQLTRWRDRQEEVLAKLAVRPEQIIWPAQRDFLLYRAGGSIWQYDFTARSAQVLSDAASRREMLGYEPTTRTLWFIRQNNDARNIWRRDLKTGAEKQLTFGSVGTARELKGALYFQYTGQRGLWLLAETQQNPRQISANLPSNSQLLRLTENAVYFVAGGPCRESAVQRLDLTSDNVSTVLPREQAKVVSYDFHPERGVLQMACRLPESDIVELLPVLSQK